MRVALIAVALIAASGLALAGCSASDDRGGEAGGDGADPLTAGPPAAPSAQPAPVAIPYVAATVEGQVMVVSKDRTASISLGGGRLSSVALSPEGKIAYIGRSRDACAESDIQPVSLEGQPAPAGPPLAPGGAGPAVSPDGRQLAYVRPSAHPCVVDTLVLRDLRTGQERAWVFAEHELSTLSWAPDNRRLAFEDSIGADGGAGLVVFDTATPPGPATAPDPLADQEEGGYTLPAFGGRSGALLALSTGAEGNREQVVVVDVRTGSLVREVFAPPQHVVAIDSDASGRHLLVVDQAQNLYYWGEGGLAQLGTGIVDADW